MNFPGKTPKNYSEREEEINMNIKLVSEKCNIEETETLCVMGVI